MSASSSPTTSTPILVAEKLVVHRGTREVLRGVSLRVDQGEVVGILGPSGSGKSTLFKALAGELQATSGSMHLASNDLSDLPLWKRARLGLGYMPQDPSVFWDLTVRENLRAYAYFTGDHPGQDDARVKERAVRVGLGERLDVVAGSLSAGERRRLELARAIVRTPKLLICDEPFAGVDPKGARALGALLLELAQSGVSVLLADHHVEEALAVTSRSLLVLDGRIEAEGTPAEFRNHPAVKGRYLGTLQGHDTPESARAPGSQ